MPSDSLEDSSAHNLSQQAHKSPKKHHKLWLLALGALGVVYGDIGTSPLYAVNEIFFGLGRTAVTQANVYGVVSLIFWVLSLIIALKYIIFVLRADNDKEGGVFALFGLISRKNLGKWILVLLMLSAGLLFGEGIITPAISVLSAVEGLKIATPTLAHVVVPATVLILSILFFIQSKGTAKVGAIFGPVIICWFVSIGLLGMHQIWQHLDILRALNPLYAINFLRTLHGKAIFYLLGAAVLVITGGEALYADMGHFGKKPIRWSWFSLVYPALILNYFGQGAYLLGHNTALHNNIFYALVPSWGLYPMVLLATLATIIASQALISGAFSLTKQAIALQLLPRLKVVHTHHEHEGQIYIPFINWALYVGCILLVLTFKSSSALAAAYGLAVSGVMLVNSLAMGVVARRIWHWSLFSVIALFGIFAFIDFSFLSANTFKLFEGGYIPLSIGVGFFLIMSTWNWGRAKTFSAFERYPVMTLRELVRHKEEAIHFLEKSMIMMTPVSPQSPSDKIPPLLQFFWERYRILPRHLILLTVDTRKEPYIHHHSERYQVNYFEEGKHGTVSSVVVSFGFMEEQNVEKILSQLAGHHQVKLNEDPHNWHVHVALERLVPKAEASWFTRFALGLFGFLRRNSQPAHYYYGLGTEVRLANEIMPVKIG